MRIARYLAVCGIASRRKAEVIILANRVMVNNEIVTDLAKQILENDQVKVDGQIITPFEKKYIVLNKPTQVLCEKGDKWKRKTVFDLIKPEDPSLFYVGRLDFRSSGLIILTNDGDFANSIIHPSKQVVKGYFVVSEENPPLEMITQFQKGIKIKGILYKAVKVKNTNQKNALIIILQEGKKREIREVYQYYQLKITKLQRISIGNLKLGTIKLGEGEYRLYKKEQLIEAIYEK
ncbi:MAG: rRNA pseudouridine synthase [Spirochaetes bacterium]|nr:rRNA pseudouridine synthase [Spirochaetota bacterium]